MPFEARFVRWIFCFRSLIVLLSLLIVQACGLLGIFFLLFCCPGCLAGDIVIDERVDLQHHRGGILFNDLVVECYHKFQDCVNKIKRLLILLKIVNSLDRLGWNGYNIV